MTCRPVLNLAALLGVVAAACAHAPPAPASAPPSSAFTPEQQRALAGTWVYTSDPVEAAALEIAIGRSVSGLFALAQGLAADSPRAHPAPRPQFTVEFEGNDA